MSLDINIHSSEEEENIHVQVEIPKAVYNAAKGIIASVDAGKTLLHEIRQIIKDKDDV